MAAPILQWSDIDYTVNRPRSMLKRIKRTKTEMVTLLDQVSGQLQEGEMLAIMGPSGAGKSTLLDVLSARQSPTKGELKVKSSSSESVKSISSYVEQDDALLGVLTVRETLWYSAKLAFPPSTTSSELDAKVDLILSSLGLKSVENNMIGTPIQRGISGGQRRRVTIGCSLITMPSVLFLDEPTSGLDVQTAYEVMSCILGFAKSNKIAVCATIHSPNWETFQLFRFVTLLAKGKTIYSGEVDQVALYFEELGYPCPRFSNPADHMLKMVSDDFTDVNLIEKKGEESHSVESLANLWKSSSRSGNKKLEEGENSSSSRDSSSHEDAPTQAEVAATSSSAPPTKTPPFKHLLSTTATLTRRNVLNYRRNLLAYGIRFAMYIGMGILLGTIWVNLKQTDSHIQDRLSVHFFSVAFLGFMSVAGIPSFLEERGVLRRERSNNLYGAAPFVIANTLVTIPFLFFCAFVFAVIAYFSIGLHSGATHFFQWLSFLYLGVLAAEMQSLLIAAMVPIFVAALALAAFLNGFWMCTQGYFISTASLPRFWYYWAHFINYETYAFALLVRTDLVGLQFPCDNGCQCSYPSSSTCSVAGQTVAKSLETENLTIGKQVAILISIIIVYRILFYITLRLQKA